MKLVNEIGTPSKPVYVHLSTTPNIRDSIGMILITVIPVAIAIIMQKPALRQAIAMRTYSLGNKICRTQADMWNNLASICSTHYDIARM